MILVYQELLQLIDNGVIKCGKNAVNPGFTDLISQTVQPASIDVHLGDVFKVENRLSNAIVSPCDGKGPELAIVRNSVTLYPGQFCLASIMEEVDLPADISCEFRLCSTVARCGLNQLMATWAECGFRGCMTLELQNCLQYACSVIKAGQRIGQLIFHRHAKSDVVYHGRYNGDKSTQEARNG